MTTKHDIHSFCLVQETSPCWNSPVDSYSVTMRSYFLSVQREVKVGGLKEKKGAGIRVFPA